MLMTLAAGRGSVVQVILHVELGVLGAAEEGLIETDLPEKVLVGLFQVKADSEVFAVIGLESGLDYDVPGVTIIGV